MALVRHNPHPAEQPQRAGALLATADEVPPAGDPSSGEVPSTLLPLFPATTTTRAGASTSTSATATTLAADVDAVSGPPAVGVYTYAVSGRETLNGTARALPPAMTLTAHPTGAASPREVVFDLRFSDEHTERDTVVFGTDTIAMRSASSTVKVGLSSRVAATSYSPAVGLVALPLRAGATRIGASQVRDDRGQVLRVEDWKLVDVAARRLTVAGSSIRAWEVTLQRASRPGAVEQLTETRRAWFDPARRMWVRWDTTLRTQRNSGGLTTNYELTYVASLTGFAKA